MKRHEKVAYFEAVVRRYHRSDKRRKGVILDEFCAVTGLGRNCAIRRFSAGYSKHRKKPGRASKYADDIQFMQALKTIWRAADRPCGKLLRKAIPLFLPKYEKHHGGLAPEVLDKLQRVSAATIDRVLEPTRRHYGKGKGLTKPGSLLREEIPLYDGYWDTTVPGFVESDTVAHCGGDLSGQFIWSLTLTGICTEWTEPRVVWHKAAHEVVKQVADVDRCLPFPLLGFDSDNGGVYQSAFG